MNKDDFENFQACFDHVDDILKVLIDELDQQLLDEHMTYSVQWDDDAINNIETREQRDLFIHKIVKDALLASMDNALLKREFDSWARIKGFMALRQSKEEIQSPISVEEYDNIKIVAEKSKPLDLESIPVNMQRPEWTEEDQLELILRKEDGLA